MIQRMSATDDLLHYSKEWAASFTQGDLGVEPTLKLAVVACMDSRLNPQALLGLRPGEAHYMRNAGGTVTDDMIRSLVISQRFLGTREIILIHHTDCGMLRFTDDELLRRWRPSPIPRRTCACPCAGCAPARSSPSRTACAASSTTSPRAA